MSRSGYSDDLDNWAMIKWRGQVASATRGRRGQRLLRDMRDALDAMPARRLIVEDLQNEGEVCALGALGQRRGIDMTDLDAHNSRLVGETFDIAHQLAAEIVYMNDEAFGGLTPEERWRAMRRWVDELIHERKKEETDGTSHR